MPQNAEKVIDHELLFREPEYTSMFAKKKNEFEFKHSDAKIAEINEWTKTEEYREKNFMREALTVNPAKACQPLGAVFAANGFKGTLPFVHGSQGCVAYYRSHFSRHFKEPTSCVSSSMTEDAAVFGGLNNMIDGLANTYNLYKPEMIAVSTTCMAEVIGHDLDAFIKTSKQKGSIPEDFDVPFAHTPAFVGSHITGYDNALKGIVQHFWTKEGERKPVEGKINFIGGFDGFVVGNMPVIRRMFDQMGVDYTVLCDPSDAWNTPMDGEFRMYDGGTTKLPDFSEAVLGARLIVFKLVQRRMRRRHALRRIEPRIGREQTYVRRLRSVCRTRRRSASNSFGRHSAPRASPRCRHPAECASLLSHRTIGKTGKV